MAYRHHGTNTLHPTFYPSEGHIGSTHSTHETLSAFAKSLVFCISVVIIALVILPWFMFRY